VVNTMSIRRIGRTGFTLIELLIVIAVIAILAAILLPVLSLIRFSANAAVTTTRLEDLGRALVECGHGQQASYIIHRDALFDPAIGSTGGPGVLAFAKDAATRHAIPAPSTPAARNGTWLTAADHHFPSPWGRNALSASTAVQSDGSTRLVLGAADQPARSATLGQLSPDRTVRLLALAGILPAGDPDALARDRGRNRTWNDRWGNALVAAHGLYQPFENTTAMSRDFARSGSWFAYSDLGLAAAEEAYRSTRIIYLTTAAAGPEPQPASDLDAQLTATWRQANEVCQQDTVWSETSWANPPWQGVKRGRRGSERCFLSAPIEIP